MRTVLLAAVAASTLAVTPATANEGNAYGRDAKVCLVTFESPEARAGQGDVDVIKAQYLPLAIAVKLEARSDDVSDIYTYGEGRYIGSEVDFNYDGDSTEDTCAYLAELGESNDNSED